MIELPLKYWNELASQLIFISALLGGFSLTVIASLLSYKTVSRVSVNLFRASIVAAASFLVTIFAMTKILMMTTKGYPLEINGEDLLFPRFIGFITFLLGILSLFVVISLAGWAKSKSIGLFATAIGILALLLVFIMII